MPHRAKDDGRTDDIRQPVAGTLAQARSDDRRAYYLSTINESGVTAGVF